jgi:hypothetical protein
VTLTQTRLSGGGTRRLGSVAVLVLLLVVAGAGGRFAGALLFVLFALSLPAAVVLHRRIAGTRSRGRDLPPILRTPGQVATAVVLVAGAGAVAVVLVSILLSFLASPLVGDGSAVVRVLLVAFVLAPCVSVGRRCGRWWAFAGAAGLVPLLGFATLAGGASGDSGLVALAVLGAASALAFGSLRSEWEAQAKRPAARRRPTTTAKAAASDVAPSRSAVG